jgi:mannose-6-phosphate isomerase-like protein (cupin superfamily)
MVDWHSTDHREELLLALGGRVEVQVQIRSRSASARRITLTSGQSLFLPSRTRHRVVNRRSAQARYVYVTAPPRAQ